MMTRTIAIAFSLSVATCGAAAAQSVIVVSSASAVCNGTGERVVAIHRDAVLGKDWEVVRNCAHPQWPARLRDVAMGPVPVNKAAAQGADQILAEPLLVHAGETVRLWQRSENVQIELSGIAEQSGHMGDQIEVRVTRQNIDGLAVQQLAGIVRGARNVEMEP